jgi:hypothetical protein
LKLLIESEGEEGILRVTLNEVRKRPGRKSGRHQKLRGRGRKVEDCFAVSFSKGFRALGFQIEAGKGAWSRAAPESAWRGDLNRQYFGGSFNDVLWALLSETIEERRGKRR